MKVGEIIARFDAHTPNAVEQDEKIRWLNSIDSQVYNDIITEHEGNTHEEFSGYTVGAEGADLLIDDGHSDIYLYYMDMRLYYDLGESTRFNNAKGMFDEIYANYQRWYIRHHRPIQHQTRWGW